MPSIFRFPVLGALPALFMALGCASTSTSSLPTEPTPKAAPVAKPSPQADVTIREATTAKLTPVYFDTDQALLKPETREALKGYARSILDHPEWGVLTIVGHCDERGSEEYNLALGKRRAAAVQRYLMDMGVPQTRLATRSFGEEKPAVAGHDETAWRYNRRSELQVDALASER